VNDEEVLEALQETIREAVRDGVLDAFEAIHGDPQPEKMQEAYEFLNGLCQKTHLKPQ
jgi:hypothetical protein